jgi:type III pantothenate kinase
LLISIGNTSLIGAVRDGSRLVGAFRISLRELGCDAFGPVPVGLGVTGNRVDSASRSASQPDVATDPSGDRFARVDEGLRRLVAEKIRGKIGAALVCSVVPFLTRRLVPVIEDGLQVRPLLLTVDSPHGIVINYRDPSRLGTDRLAASIGARARHPGRNILVVDCGTATTVTAVSKDGVLLGGAILPGIDLWPGMLAARTAQLPRVRLRRPTSALGRSPEEAIASGVWHGHAGAILKVMQEIKREAFKRSAVLIIGTGGQSRTGAAEGLFSVVEPHLVLHGLAAYAATLKAP